jgi:esterase/lipase superfamily enzyme
MLTISFRDSNNWKKFSPDITKDGEPSYWIAEAMTLSHKRIILVVHGYCNDPEDVQEAYKQIETHFNPIEDLLVGIEWPSNGCALGYLSDRRDAAMAGKLLGKVIDDLYHEMQENPKIKVLPVHIMTHSMGGRVFAESLPEFGKFIINTWVAFSADVARRKLRSDQAYGQNHSRVKKAYFYHSDEDRILKYVAPLVLPVSRVGRHGLNGKNRPANFCNVDATEIDKEMVRHNSYRKSAVLIPHALKMMKGNE